MNTLRQICAAIILSLTLAVSVLAGHIDTPGIVAPAPTPTPETSTTTQATTITAAILRTRGQRDVVSKSVMLWFGSDACINVTQFNTRVGRTRILFVKSFTPLVQTPVHAGG